MREVSARGISVRDSLCATKSAVRDREVCAPLKSLCAGEISMHEPSIQLVREKDLCAREISVHDPSVQLVRERDPHARPELKGSTH